MPGSYKIEVEQLAQTERRYSKGFDDSDAAGVAGEGTLSIQVGTEDAVEVEVEATDTLQDIVAKINAADVGVSAGILFNGTQYFVQLSGVETGADNSLTVTEGGTLDMDLDDASANIVQDAQDAQIKMDGFTITSASNDVTTAISGVTLSLHAETATDETVDVSILSSMPDISEKVEGFIDAYNEVVSIIRSEFAYTGEAKSAGRLAGDSTLRNLQMQLSTMITSSLDDLTGDYTALSQIGIKSGTDGQLSLDKEIFAEALSEDAEGVSQIFSGTGDEGVQGIADKLDDLIEMFVDFSDGLLTAKVNGINATIKGIDKSIERQEEHLTKYEERLRAQFTSMEVMMNTLVSQGNFLASQSFLW
jgi:flagellar hook-associated protein 2